MVLLNWTVFIKRSWIILMLCLFTGAVSVLAACPKDASTKAHSCFTSYSFHIQNMHNSPYKLCCGVDVEILRAFCQSYISAMTCIRNLKRGCPEDIVRTIDTALKNVNGVQNELEELCSDDSIIENYAMYQTCFSTVGDKSEMCLQTHLNGSSSIKFLSKVHINGKIKFCKDLDSTIECVRKSVKLSCGEEAAQLVHVLVKPMIRQSAECDHSVINVQQKLAKRPHQGHQAYVRENQGNDKSGAKLRDKNMASDARQASAVVLWVSVCILALLILTIRC